MFDHSVSLDVNMFTIDISILLYSYGTYRISGTFDGDFNLADLS